MLHRIGHRAAALGGLLALLFIAFATMSPILERPTVASQGLEHVAAFAVVGGLFQVGFPARGRYVALLLALAIVGLEAAQHLTADRHGTLLDVGRKMPGASLGIAAGRVANRVAARRGGWPGSVRPMRDPG